DPVWPGMAIFETRFGGVAQAPIAEPSVDLGRELSATWSVRPAQQGTHHPGERMMIINESYDIDPTAPKLDMPSEANSTATIYPTDEGDPGPQGTETQPLDIQSNCSTDQRIDALAYSLVRYVRWKRSLARAREERKLARREKREEAAA